MPTDMLPLLRSKVRVGRPLQWNIRNREGGLLLRCGHVIENERELDVLLELGAFVDVEEVKAVARREHLKAAEPQSPERRPLLQTSVFDLWSRLKTRLQELARVLPPGEGWVEGLDALAQDLIGLAEREPDIGIYLMVRQEGASYIEYGYAHAVHCAMVCVLLSRRLAWPAAETASLVRAALTMNLPILELQGRMAGQEEAVLERQRLQIRDHPRQAVKLLAEAGITDPLWLAAVADHHEHVDGTGYPQGKKDVGRMAQALRLSDVFTAKLSRRLIRPPLTPQEAERQMYAEGKVDPSVMELAMAIIKELGIYPPGDVVQLKSGEIAVVVRRSAGANTPLVAAITDRQRKPVTSTVRIDSADPAHAIVGPVADKSWVARMPPERVYGFGRI